MPKQTVFDRFQARVGVNAHGAVNTWQEAANTWHEFAFVHKELPGGIGHRRSDNHLLAMRIKRNDVNHFVLQTFAS